MDSIKQMSESRSLMKEGRRPSLHVHVVEYHNDALRPLLNSIDSHPVPIRGNLLLHLDSHPELLIPPDLTAQAAMDRESLCASLDIGNWILPAAFAGHFSTIVWVKPPWSSQIPEGRFEFDIGVEKSSGTVKVSSKLPYFITDVLHAPEKDLTDKKRITLYVYTVGNIDEVQNKLNYCNDGEIVNEIKTTGSLINELIEEHGGAYFLDVDFDYFTTLNPFMHLYKNNSMYDQIKSIYNFDLDESASVEDNQLTRKKSLKPLDIFFKSLTHLKSSGEIISKLPKLFEIFSDRQVSWKVRTLVEYLMAGREVLKEDWSLLHNAGCTSDSENSALPNHPSTNAEITTLVRQFSSLLDCLPRPMIVTLARSSLDEYCPPCMVDHVQDLVIQQLYDKYQVVRIKKEY